MRVRVIKDFSTINKDYEAGQVIIISPKQAAVWIDIGLVMEDKSQDGARETK